MSAKKDYDLLARKVHCERCGARPGKRCFGSRGTPIQSTHVTRRALAAKTRRETP